MQDYYSKKLSADRLRRVYEVASPRVRRYLDAEVEFVKSHLKTGDRVIELGCGYGRILPPLAEKAGLVTGIDSSIESIRSGIDFLSDCRNCSLAVMSAGNLGFRDRTFDCVVCIQNGISAFKIDPVALVGEAIRVCRDDGVALFSTYSAKFWDHRLEWFEVQSRHGLLGEIDYAQTGDGQIVCKDGFRATTFTKDDFREIAEILDVSHEITEVDESSLFCAYSRNNSSR
jgi:2-polyprenyl-6-hydroxyphenyl methylase/3-demethylubiquinone-9 3-methyltransferase